MSGLIGKKVGMTSIFDENGKNIPCTIIEAGPCVVTQVRTKEVDGYEALQLGFDDKKEKHTSKAAAGHFAKAGVTPKKKLVEFQGFESTYKLGDTITAEFFVEGEFVDVTGTSKGKGFQGVVRRHGFGGVGQSTHGQHNFGGNRASHGVSRNHRLGGSNAGGAASNSNVPKGKKMAGRLGAEKVTVQNLKVLKVIPEKNLIILKGCVPGHKNAYVTIHK